MVAKLAGWAKQAGEKIFHLYRLNIGPRLALCFIFIILAMLVGYAVLLWQFQQVRAQAERLSGVDQELITVLQAHTKLMSFYERLDSLAHLENTAGLVSEAQDLRDALLEDNRRSRSVLSGLPQEVQLDPTLLPTLVAIQDALPAQLEAITVLAKSKDWDAVRLRLANQVRPLESRSAALVENIDREVGQARAQAVLNIGQAQRRVLLIVPITAILTLLFAAFLGWAITHSITEPLGRLLGGSKALARGEFQHQVSVIGKDELAHVSTVFNETAGKLRELYETLRVREEKLRQSEDSLRTTIDTIPTLAWVCGPDGAAEIQNQRWLSYTGLSQAQVAGWGWVVAIYPQDLPELESHWRATLSAGEPFEHEVRMRRFDGEYRWFLFRATPLRDKLGDILKWYATNTDIHDRKLAEDGLRKLASLVENSTDFIGMASLEGDVLFINPAGQAVVGLAGSKQVYETKILDYIAEQDLERFGNDVLPVVFKDGRWEGETLFRHFKTGASISMWQHIFFITDEGSGRRLALATVCRDITERKRSEEKFQHAQAQLAHMARLTTMGELAASIAHEVNQPLAAIVANGNACLRWLRRAEPDLDEAQTAVDRIVRDGRRAGDIISRIRALSKQASTEKESLDVNGIIQEVVALIQAEVRRNRVALRTELADDLPRVLGDRVQLQQVLLNLVMNGIEAMRRVEDRPRELVIRTQKGDECHVCVAVQDSGMGLDSANMDRIFDAFYTTKREGMGMGLSISRSIVENHGGRLRAAANKGPGATFEFTLAEHR